MSVYWIVLSRRVDNTCAPRLPLSIHRSCRSRSCESSCIVSKACPRQHTAPFPAILLRLRQPGSVRLQACPVNSPPPGATGHRPIWHSRPHRQRRESVALRYSSTESQRTAADRYCCHGHSHPHRRRRVSAALRCYPTKSRRTSSGSLSLSRALTSAPASTSICTFSGEALQIAVYKNGSP